MHRYLLTILLLFACAGAWAQDSAAQDETEARESQESEEADAAEADDLDLDEESYMDAEEEDFVPSEDIPADQAIPFPTDI